MRFSFSRKLFLLILTLVAVTFTLGGNLLLYSSFSAARSRRSEDAMRSFRMIQYTASAVAVNDSVSRMVELLPTLQSENRAALRLTENGETLYRSGLPEEEERYFGTRSAPPDTTEVQRVIFKCGNEHYLRLTSLLQQSGRTFVLQGVFSLEDAYAALHTQQDLYRLAYCVSLALGAVLAYALSRVLTKPLIALSTASRSIASGDLSFRADETGQDEFSLLARDFNRMTDQLQEKIDALTDAMQRQEAFTGAFAHEMKTPMTSIIGYADLLRSRALPEAEQRRCANYIFTESRRLEQLSIKLLDLLVLRRRDFPLTPTAIDRLVEETVRVFAPVMKQHHIVLKGTVESGERPAEPDLLKTLLLNLLDNARKAMPEGGEIRLRQTLTVNGFSIAVTDTGCGMAPEELQRITEAFYRVDKARSRAQGGVGLGLAISKEIAELHGGTLRFESTPGRGTRVTLITGEAEI